MRWYWITLIVFACVIPVAAVVMLALLLSGVLNHKLSASFVVVNSKNSSARITTGTAPDHSDLTIDHLEYALTSISIAESATLLGSSFNNMQNQMTADLTGGKNADFDVHYTNLDTNTIEFVDLMDQKAVDAKLTAFELKQKTSPDNVKKGFKPSFAFKFMQVEYLRPPKLQATTTASTGEKLYTKQDTLTTENTLPDSTGAHGESHTSYNSRYGGTFLNNPPAQPMTVIMNNSTSWLKLPEPGITVTQEDMKNSHLALLYDPYLNLRGLLAESTDEKAQESDLVADKDGNSWSIPILSNIPILVPNGDTVLRDIFTLSYPEVTFDILLVVYYLKSDSTSIRGASTGVVRRGTNVFPKTAPNQLPQVMELKINVDAGKTTWSFLGIESVSATTRTTFISNVNVQQAAGTCTCSAYQVGTGVFGVNFTGTQTLPTTQVDYSVPYTRTTYAEVIHQ